MPKLLKTGKPSCMLGRSLTAQPDMVLTLIPPSRHSWKSRGWENRTGQWESQQSSKDDEGMLRADQGEDEYPGKGTSG